MLQDTDLDAAVAQGIVTSAQADALRDLARQRAAELSHEERFRFLKGFNDVFFTIGVVLFLIGAAYYVANYAPSHITGLVVMAVIVWVLAEFLVARMRLVLPGILLALAFVGLVLAASVGVPMESRLGSGNQVRMPTALSLLQGLQYYPGGPLVFSLRALVPAAAAAAFYWRFKLPFALLPLAASLVIAALGVASFLAPQAAAVADTIVFLLCGLGVFAAAMSFDISDRERLTRRADCAFWLHLLAAPLIMHSVISLATRPLAGDLGRGLAMSSTAALAVIAVVAVLALVALLIDRRALLVSGLAYLGVAIALILRGDAPVPAASVLPTTLVILGGIVLTLGAGWVQLRRLLLALVPPAISNRLPPVPARP